MPEENNKNEEQQQDNGEITDDGNYSRPTGTSTGSVFITRYIYFGRSYHVKKLNLAHSISYFFCSKVEKYLILLQQHA